MITSNRIEALEIDHLPAALAVGSEQVDGAALDRVIPVEKPIPMGPVRPWQNAVHLGICEHRADPRLVDLGSALDLRLLLLRELRALRKIHLPGTHHGRAPQIRLGRVCHLREETLVRVKLDGCRRKHDARVVD